jgi:hypothetical protein
VENNKRKRRDAMTIIVENKTEANKRGGGERVMSEFRVEVIL